MVEFAACFYPEARMSGRLHLGIQALWRDKDTPTQEGCHAVPAARVWHLAITGNRQRAKLPVTLTNITLSGQNNTLINGSASTDQRSEQYLMTRGGSAQKILRLPR